MISVINIILVSNSIFPIYKSKGKLRLTFLSGFWISGKTAQNGFITSKNFTGKDRTNGVKFKDKTVL